MRAEPVLLLATRNAGKLMELNGILAGFGVNAIDLDAAGIGRRGEEDGLECFDSLRANALAKARYFHRLSDMPTLADDSGLSVDALDGQPGVHSRRYSGRDDLSGRELDDANNRKLIGELRATLHPAARFECAAAYVDADLEMVEECSAEGEMVRAPRGENGFGYDPYFLSSDLGKTFAEATMEEKAPVSHRGRAFGALVVKLRERGRI
ncbi:MAG: non-canonical purine NTP pyrophosphatase [Gemmatimonadaceae bacterium]